MTTQLVGKMWDRFSERFPRFASEINYFRRNRHFEVDMWTIPTFTEHNSIAIDVGANMGIFSRWMAKHVQHVHSFECNPMLFESLNRILPNNATLHKYALSSEKGMAELRFDPVIQVLEPLNRPILLKKMPASIKLKQFR